MSQGPSPTLNTVGMGMDSSAMFYDVRGIEEFGRADTGSQVIIKEPDFIRRSDRRIDSEWWRRYLHVGHAGGRLNEWL